MAKARDIPGLDARMPFTEAAAATVAMRAEEMFEQAEGVLDISDIERVHDMRVASRRLRAVLEIYAPCFPPEEFRPILREVKALADALGARRDPDVLLEQLAKLEGKLPKADAPGVEAFAAPVHDEQAHGNEILAAALEHADRTDLRGRLALLAARAAAPEEPEEVAAAPEPSAAEPSAAEPPQRKPPEPESAPELEPEPPTPTPTPTPATVEAVEAVGVAAAEPGPTTVALDATANGDGPTP